MSNPQFFLGKIPKFHTHHPATAHDLTILDLAVRETAGVLGRFQPEVSSPLKMETVGHVFIGDVVICCKCALLLSENGLMTP